MKSCGIFIVGLWLGAVMACVWIIFMAPPAHSHEWYESRCCSGRDCHSIDNPTVTVTPDGYVVTLTPADHPFVRKTITQTWRFPDADPANNYPMGPAGNREATYGQDENYHACVMPGGAWLCLYLPENGS